MASIDNNNNICSKLSEFRNCLTSDDIADFPDEYFGDFSLLRWLNAYHFKIDALLPKFRYYMSVIRALKLQHLTFADVDAIQQYVDAMSSGMTYFPRAIMGEDVYGNVVVMQPLALAQSHQLLRAGRSSELYIVSICEAEGTMKLLRRKEAVLGRKLGTVLIIDMDGFSMDNVWMPAIKLFGNVLQLLQDLFPDVANRICVINAPTAIRFLYRFIEPILATSTRAKVEFMGTDWKRELTTFIDPSQIYAHWGGTKPASTPFGNIRMGGPVPVELINYCRNRSKSLNDQNLTRVHLSTGKSHSETIRVTKVGNRLQWVVNVEDGGDVSMTIVCTNDERTVLIWPRLRIYTEYCTEWGETECDIVGDYTITFANDHSMFRGKTINYRISVIDG